MNFNKFFLFLILVVQGCIPASLNFKVTDTIPLEQIPGGSGIIRSVDGYYVIGDDSPTLFFLDNDFTITAEIRLLDAKRGERITKPEKPDFESMEWINSKEIVVFGSGSVSPQRDIFFRIILNETPIVEKYSIVHFYKNLRELPEFEDSELNIEATAFHKNDIFLFNRRKNLILQFNYTELLRHIKGEANFPKPQIHQFSLPEINGIEAGFSGATTLSGESKIIFTASVEDTNNAYDDGKILGSFIGMIDIQENKISNTLEYCRIPGNGENLKVESVCVEKEFSKGKTNLALITDDDMGNSIMLRGILDWQAFREQ